MLYGKPGTDSKAPSFAQQQEWDTPATPRFRKDASSCRPRKRIIECQEYNVVPDRLDGGLARRKNAANSAFSIADEVKQRFGIEAVRRTCSRSSPRRTQPN